MNKRKKILFIHHDNGLGGAPLSLSILINQLNKDEFNSTVLLIKYSRILEELFRKSGAKVLYQGRMFPFHGTTVSGYRLRTFFVNIVGFPITLLKALFVIREIKADLVYLNTTCLFAFAIVSKILKRDRKIISHVREPILPGFKGFPLRFFNKLFVDYFIGISNYDLKSLKNNKIPQDVIFNSFDYRKSNLSGKSKRLFFKEKYNLDKNKIILLYLGRVSKSNGVLDLIFFFKKYENLLSKRYYLFIVGYDYSDKSSYSLEVKNEANRIQEFCKLVDKTSEISEFLEGCDFIISPFITAHFSRSIIEGYSYGKPCIATNVSSQNELVLNKKTGYLYNNYPELKELLIENDIMKFYDNMSRDCLKWGFENFDERTNNARIINVIRKNLSKC